MVTPENPFHTYDKDILEACSRSTLMTAKTFFPERFTREFDDHHLRIIEALDDESIRKLLILAPRGSGKTSLVQLAYIGRLVLFGLARYIIPISSSQFKAENHSEGLKTDLVNSSAIKTLFPMSMKTDSWAKGSWTAATEVRVEPTGAGQDSVRGALYRNWRPDHIILDDFEKKEELGNEVIRAANWSWLNSTVMGALDRANPGRMIMIATLSHHDCAAARIMRDPKEKGWTVVRSELCDDQLNSEWPIMISTATIRKEYETYKANDALDEFYMEFRNQPVATENKKFTQAMFRDFDPASEEFVKLRWRLVSYVVVDPARTTEPTSADTAIVGVSYDPETGNRYVRDLELGKFHPEEIYDKSLRMAAAIDATAIGIEVTGLSEFVSRPFLQAMARSGRNFRLEELKAKGKKEDRIAGLLPDYREGRIFHNPAVCRPLEEQLLCFPKSRLWDAMDAFGYSIEMEEKGDLVPESRALAMDKKAMENELEELATIEQGEDYVEEDLGRWRVL